MPPPPYRYVVTIDKVTVSEYSTLLYAASDNRLPACFQFKVSEQPNTVSSIRPGGPGWNRTNGVSGVPDLQSGVIAN